LFTRKADLLFVVMAWVFVLSRLAHAYAYATSDIVMLRFQIFLVGAMVLMLMWAIFAGRSLFGAL
jgi:hypothetical protein